MIMGNKKEYNLIPESLRENLEMTQKVQNSLAPIVEQKNLLQESMAPALEAQAAINAVISEIQPAVSMKVDNPMIEAMQTLANNKVVMGLGELAIKSAIPTYQFESPALKAFEHMSNHMVTNIATGLTTLVQSSVMQQIQSFTSTIGKWLQSVDFTPLINILEDVQLIGFEYDYDKVNEILLKAMSDARWFPYAGWIADFRIVGELIDILNTSRASKNRIKRIDKLIFAYYDKEEINNFKRRWRQMNLPSYMTRILIQSVQAYHRREYALTVSTLSTLWEGIIQEKVNDESYRISRKTRQNLSKLIEANEFDKIFASFCEEFIFYDCKKPEDVKQDVPGRHGIAHCWYNAYPNRKMALNAILFTDFLLELKPMEQEKDVTE